MTFLDSLFENFDLLMTLVSIFQVIPVSGPDGVKSNTKKYTIIGVSVVLVIAVIVGGFVGGMFLMQKSSNNMVEVRHHLLIWIFVSLIKFTMFNKYHHHHHRNSSNSSSSRSSSSSSS